MTKSARLGLSGSALLLIVGLFIFLPPIIGSKIEKNYEKAFNRFATHNGWQDLSPSFTYERHWFSSYVTEEVQYKGHTIKSVARIAHGPLAHTEAQGWYLGFGAPFELLSVVVDETQSFDDIHAHGTVTLLGNFHVNAVIDGVEINNVKMTPITVQAKGNINYEMNMSLELPRLSVIVTNEMKGPKKDFIVSNEIAYQGVLLTAEVDLSENLTGFIFPSEVELAVKRYAVQTHIDDLDTSSIVAMNDLVYSVKTGLIEAENILNSHHDMKIGDIQLNQYNVGPFEASIQINNIDVEPYMYIIDRLGREPTLVSALKTDEKLGEAIDELLSHQPELIIDELTLNILEGIIEANMTLQVAPEVDWRSASSLELVQLHSKIVLPKPILRRLVEVYVKTKLMPSLVMMPDQKFTPEEMADLEQEFIVKTMSDLENMKFIELTEDERYRTELAVEKGQISVNGNSMLSFKSE